MAIHAIVVPVLRRQLPGPDQRRLRQADHAQRPVLQQRGVWPGRRCVLHRLFLRRSAQQHDFAPGRSTALDRAHHDHLVADLGGDRAGADPHAVLHRAILPGHCRGRFFPGHRALSHPLVSCPSPGQDGGVPDGRQSRLRHPQRPGVGLYPAYHERGAWPGRVAVVVHH
ncbi:hypothetical protein D3C86_1643260 [compost metagenome]